MTSLFVVVVYLKIRITSYETIRKKAHVLAQALAIKIINNVTNSLKLKVRKFKVKSLILKMTHCKDWK